jgi:hypothetical protein
MMRCTVKMFWVCFGLLLLGYGFLFAQQNRSRPTIVKAPAGALEQLKRAHVAYEQGWYEQVITLASAVYRQHGDVTAAWFPTWVQRFAKGDLPDPYDTRAVIGHTVRSHEQGQPSNLSYAREVTTPSSLLMDANYKLGNYEEAIKWAEFILAKRPHSDGAYATAQAARRLLSQKYRPPQPPAKSTWKSLKLRFQEEDYFVLVPLDEASQVLGLPYRYKANSKTGKRTGAQIGGKGLLSVMGNRSARNMKGEIDTMAYAPFEKDGEVWVPFYWLAKQAGIPWWEVRNGKIYVAPRPMGTDRVRKLPMGLKL